MLVWKNIFYNNVILVISVYVTVVPVYVGIYFMIDECHFNDFHQCICVSSCFDPGCVDGARSTSTWSGGCASRSGWAATRGATPAATTPPAAATSGDKTAGNLLKMEFTLSPRILPEQGCKNFGGPQPGPRSPSQLTPWQQTLEGIIVVSWMRFSHNA